MVIEKGLIKGINSTIRVLTKIWGVQGEIYKPKKNQKININSYYEDTFIEYEDTPFYKGKLLVPFVFYQSPNTPLVYEDISTEKVLYLEQNIEVPLYSLVKIKINNKILDFKIIDIEVINGENEYIYRKYNLAPALQQLTTNEVEELNLIEQKVEEETLTDNEIEIENINLVKIDRIG